MNQLIVRSALLLERPERTTWWYLPDETVGLAVFPNQIHVTENVQIVNRLIAGPTTRFNLHSPPSMSAHIEYPHFSIYPTPCRFHDL